MASSRRTPAVETGCRPRQFALHRFFREAAYSDGDRVLLFASDGTTRRSATLLGLSVAGGGFGLLPAADGGLHIDMPIRP